MEDVGQAAIDGRPTQAPHGPQLHVGQVPPVGEPHQPLERPPGLSSARNSSGIVRSYQMDGLTADVLALDKPSCLILNALLSGDD